MTSLEDFIADIEAKGFKLNDEAIGFIYFGQKFTNAPDQLVQIAIEITLKLQRGFDSSFYLSVLEEMVQEKILSRQVALTHFREKGIKI